MTILYLNIEIFLRDSDQDSEIYLVNKLKDKKIKLDIKNCLKF